jgi:hypothetical protein
MTLLAAGKNARHSTVLILGEFKDTHILDTSYHL